MDKVTPPCVIECPECSWRVWCTEVDPDAGIAEMWGHVKDHAAARAGSFPEMQMLTLGLMAKVVVVPDA